MLAPFVIGMGALALRSTGANRKARPTPLKPLFVVGLACTLALNSFITISSNVQTWLMILTTWFLSMALASSV